MRTAVLIGVSMLLLTGAGGAQEDRREPARVLAPFIDDTTFAVGEIDVKNIDFDTLFSHAAKPKLATLRPEELARQSAEAKQFQAGFLRAGGRYIYLVFSLTENLLAAPHPLIVVPAEKAETRDTVAAFLKSIRGPDVETHSGLVLAGPKQALQAYRQIKPREIPQFAQAFTALGTSPQRLVAVMPTTVRRALEELQPDLPAAIGGGSIKTITRGLAWIGAGLDLSEKFQMQVLIQADNADDAQKLENIALRGTELFLKEARLPAALAAVLRPKRDGSRLDLALDGKTIDATLLMTVGRVREAASRAQSMNNLKQIALAMHNYHDVNKSLPPHASYDKQKKPLLSWRVHILPFVDASDLYKEFKLQEPWESPHNKKLIARMPKTYRSPLASDLVEAGKTTYLVPLGPKLLFNGPKALKIQQITDGTSNTILALDVDESRAVYWTQPDDLRVDPKQPKAGLVHPGIGILAAYADGSVRVLPEKTTDETFWAFLTATGGEAIKDE